MKIIYLLSVLALAGCGGTQYATLSGDNACWIQSAANAAGKIATDNGADPKIAEAASVLSTVAGVACIYGKPATAAPVQ